MSQINVRTLDLNLLRILVTLADTGSVSKAAALMSMSQPATSSALKRLRIALGDPLFLRTGAGMVPTPYAEAILPDVRHHMSGLLDSVEARRSFDPKRSEKTFRLSLSGLGEAVFVPILLQHLWREAPFVELVNVPTSPRDLPTAFSTGKLDCAIGIIEVQGPGLHALDLFEDRYVFVSGRGLKDPPRKLEDLRACRLVVSRPDASFATDIDRLLSQAGLDRSVRLRLGHFGAIAPLIDQHPVVAVIPEQLAKQHVANQGATILPIQLAQPRQIVRLIWPDRHNDDQAQSWLRGLITKVLRR